MNSFAMSFVDLLNPQLSSTTFSSPHFSGERCCVRGKSSGPYLGYGTFQWTAAVRALTYLFIISARAKKEGPVGNPPILLGQRKSLAVSLDYALAKQPLWIMDMFGTDKYGRLLVRQFLRCLNSGQKRPGPVAISLSKTFLEQTLIVIEWEGKNLDDTNLFQHLASRLAQEEHCPVLGSGDAHL